MIGEHFNLNTKLGYNVSETRINILTRDRLLVKCCPVKVLLINNPTTVSQVTFNENLRTYVCQSSVKDAVHKLVWNMAFRICLFGLFGWLSLILYT